MPSRSGMLAGLNSAMTRSGNNRPARMTSGVEAVPVALHRLQWSQTEAGFDAGAAGL